MFCATMRPPRITNESAPSSTSKRGDRAFQTRNACSPWTSLVGNWNSASGSWRPSRRADLRMAARAFRAPSSQSRQCHRHSSSRGRPPGRPRSGDGGDLRTPDLLAASSGPPPVACLGHPGSTGLARGRVRLLERIPRSMARRTPPVRSRSNVASETKRHGAYSALFGRRTIYILATLGPPAPVNMRA